MLKNIFKVTSFSLTLAIFCSDITFAVKDAPTVITDFSYLWSGDDSRRFDQQGFPNSVVFAITAAMEAYIAMNGGLDQVDSKGSDTQLSLRDVWTLYGAMQVKIFNSIHLIGHPMQNFVNNWSFADAYSKPLFKQVKKYGLSFNQGEAGLLPDNESEEGIARIENYNKSIELMNEIQTKLQFKGGWWGYWNKVRYTSKRKYKKDIGPYWQDKVTTLSKENLEQKKQIRDFFEEVHLKSATLYNQQARLAAYLSCQPVLVTLYKMPQLIKTKENVGIKSWYEGEKGYGLSESAQYLSYGHSVLLVGFRQTKNNNYVFKAKNSWGDGSIEFAGMDLIPHILDARVLTKDDTRVKYCDS